MLGLVQSVGHGILYWSLERVSQQIGKGIEEVSDVVGPVQDYRALGLGKSSARMSNIP